MDNAEFEDSRFFSVPELYYRPLLLLVDWLVNSPVRKETIYSEERNNKEPSEDENKFLLRYPNTQLIGFYNRPLQPFPDKRAEDREAKIDSKPHSKQH